MIEGVSGISFETLTAQADKGLVPDGENIPEEQYTQEDVRFLNRRESGIKSKLEKINGMTAQGRERIRVMKEVLESEELAEAEAKAEEAEEEEEEEKISWEEWSEGKIMELNRCTGWLESVYSSEEYRTFTDVVHKKLGNVRGKTVVFDIEATLVHLLDFSNGETIIRYSSPWMQAIVEELTADGKNTVRFLTAAKKESMGELRGAMSPSIAELPSIDRDDWINIITIIRSGYNNGTDPVDIAQEIKEKYPQINQEACQENMQNVFTALKDVISTPKDSWYTSEDEEMIKDKEMLGDDRLFKRKREIEEALQQLNVSGDSGNEKSSLENELLAIKKLQDKRKLERYGAGEKYPAFLFGGADGVIFVDDYKDFKDGAVKTGMRSDHFVYAINNLRQIDAEKILDSLTTACAV